MNFLIILVLGGPQLLGGLSEARIVRREKKCYTILDSLMDPCNRIQCSKNVTPQSPESTVSRVLCRTLPDVLHLHSSESGHELLISAMST
ncbi:hypothetical protein EDC04DRAFT_1642451 [Pisolithus marmoratus]|nr:hypothetical protein EDC04DRAFT_1642451 [Pisolithus marmoratus]